MNLLIATDVFGNTPAIPSLTRALGQHCVVVSPYADPAHYYLKEQDAYHAFLAGGGVLRYAEKISGLLKQQKFAMAIGFSAGASALWLAGTGERGAHLGSAQLFYGSRVRELHHLPPRCPVNLIFAEQEAAFEPKDLIKRLRAQGYPAELARGTRHGFMNPYSGGFSANVQQHYLERLQSLCMQAGCV